MNQAVSAFNVRVVSDEEAKALAIQNELRAVAKRRAKQVRREADLAAKNERVAQAMQAAQSKALLAPKPTRDEVRAMFGVIVEGNGRSLLDAKREHEARLTAERLFAWMEKEYPTLEVIENEFRAALFAPIIGNPTGWACEGVILHTDQVERGRIVEANHAKRRVLEVLRGTNHTAKLEKLAAEGFEPASEDESGNAIYAYARSTGVTVTLYGSAPSKPVANKQFGRHLTPEQQAAADRRAQNAAKRPKVVIEPSEKLKRESAREARRLERSRNSNKGASGAKKSEAVSDGKKGGKKK